MFTKKYVEDLPVDSAEAGMKICNDFFSLYRKTNLSKNQLLDAYSFLKAFLRSIDLELGEPIPRDTNTVQIGHWVEKLFVVTREHFVPIIREREGDEFGQIFTGKYRRTFSYEFSDGDIQIIQKKINELRELIGNSEYMDDQFKSRLLKKLEGLQVEFHKRMSDLDRFWGLLGDAGVALGKFGNDAKPFLDRVKELMQIVWRTQARAEELPTDSPLPELGQEHPK